MSQIDVDNFREWLSRKYKSKKTIGNRISNCNRVVEFEGDLDKHFAKDDGKALMERLTFSRRDSVPNHKIPFNGDYHTGTSTLKGAVKLYFEFKESTKKK